MSLVSKSTQHGSARGSLGAGIASPFHNSSSSLGLSLCPFYPDQQRKFSIVQDIAKLDASH
ncbi:hypothetical protein ABZ820_00805 [Streptomyces diacarni]|uniref:hypothetical protein n=1 Tax=Streptomyces diacarni TaxID=2800381 RepID=UPI0033EBA24D